MSHEGFVCVCVLCVVSIGQASHSASPDPDLRPRSSKLRTWTLILNEILVFILLIKYSLRSQLVKQLHMDLHIPVENVIVKYDVVSRI